MSDNITPVLYILMRSDLDSMNTGKAMAQASHASNAFVHGIKAPSDKVELTEEQLELFDAWVGCTEQGFGTVIVLDVGDESSLNWHVSAAQSAGLISDYVLDPTYPVRDGEALHLIPVYTCGYVFADKDDDTKTFILNELELHD